MIGTPVSLPIAVSLPIEATAPRKWAIYHEMGEAFGDDDDHDGLVIHIALTGPEAIAAANHLLATLGQPEGLDSDLAARIGWPGDH